MRIRASSHAIGVQVTESGAYMVLLERRKGNVGGRVVAYNVIDTTAEGIVSQSELQTAIRSWVTSHQLGAVPVTVALSQNDVSCAVNRLPKTDDREKLKRLIYFQALGGVADEAFDIDFVQYPSVADESPRTLLLLGREQRAEECMGYLLDAGLNVSTLTCEGLALVNGLFRLHPEASAPGNDVEVLLYAGMENPLVVVLYHGEIQAVSELEPVSSALKMPLETRLVQFMRKLPGTAADSGGVSQIYLCGEHPGLQELARRLEATFRVDVTMLEAPLEMAGSSPEAASCLMIAFGAALQGIGQSVYTLHLEPKSLAWANLRRRSVTLLRLAFLALVLGILTFATLFTRHLIAVEEEVARREQAVEECKRLEERIELAYRNMQAAQNRILPLHALSTRTGLFLDCLDAWKQCRPKDSGWEVYMADDFMYQLVNDPETRWARRAKETAASARSAEQGEEMLDAAAREAEAELPAREASPQEPAAAGGLFETAQPPVSVSYPARRLVSQIRPIRAIYIGGYTVSKSGAMYQTIKELQDKLRATGLFGNVDDCLERSSPVFVERCFAPWNAFLERNKEALRQQNTPFLLELPFREAADQP